MLSRKEFLFGVASAAAAIVVSACGGDDSSNATTGEGDGSCSDDVDATISSNHGHTLAVPPADLESTASKMYSIKGASDHDHTVTLTAQDFADLKAMKKVVKESTSNSGHSHPVQIIC